MNRMKLRFFIMWLIIICLCAFLGGCSYFQNTTTSSNGTTSSKKKGIAPVYYDFNDVLLPGELKIVKKSTMVVQSPDFTSGIITLKGHVESNSIMKFFKNHMASDNWNIVSYIKSPSSILMLFHKDGRWCMITIGEKEYNTYVQVGVAPTMGVAGSEVFK